VLTRIKKNNEYSKRGKKRKREGKALQRWVTWKKAGTWLAAGTGGRSWEK